MNTIFNFNRTGLLMKRYFTERFQSELIYWGIFVVVFMLFRNNIAAIGGIIFVAGAIFASRFSREIHSPAGGINYFMIPATHLEKLTLTLLFTSVYYFVMMVIAYTLGNLIGTGLHNLLAGTDLFGLFHHSPLQWKLFEYDNSSSVMVNGHPMIVESGHFILGKFFFAFLFIQSLFTLGGIYFKRSHTFKTLFALIVVGFVLVIFLGLEIRLILEVPNINPGSINPEKMLYWKSVLDTVGKLFCYLLPPFLWVVSYFRLTEKQV